MHRLRKLWWRDQKKNQKVLSLMVMRECVGMRRFLEQKSHHRICDFSDTHVKKKISCYFSIPGAFKGTFLLQHAGEVGHTGEGVIAPVHAWILAQNESWGAGLCIVMNLIKQTIVINFLWFFFFFKQVSAFLSFPAKKYLPQTSKILEVRNCEGVWGCRALTNSVRCVVQLGWRAGHAAALMGGSVAPRPLTVF